MTPSQIKHLRGQLCKRKERFCICTPDCAEVHSLLDDWERMSKDIENLIWNLAGCSTFALGYGLDEPYAKDMARPALEDVRKLALREKQMREALEKIVVQEQTAGKYIGTAEHLRNIAHQALGSEGEENEC